MKINRRVIPMKKNADFAWRGGKFSARLVIFWNFRHLRNGY